MLARTAWICSKTLPLWSDRSTRMADVPEPNGSPGHETQQAAPPPVRLGFLRCLRFRSAIMSFFRRSAGRRFFPRLKIKGQNDVPTFLLSALYTPRPVISKHFFLDLSEAIRIGPKLPGLAFPWPIGRYGSLECGGWTPL